MVLGGLLAGRELNVSALLSNGELPEAAVWEAAMSAAPRRARRLIAIVDRNGIRSTAGPRT